jgi:pimeloyl-ACP methyl ester carboxylesterase
MVNWRRITGVAGVAAAGAVGVVAAERIAVARLRARADRKGDEPFGTLRGRELTLMAGDGVPLHVEIDGPDAAPATIIFCHGYTLNQDCWHFQRRDLDGHRLVFWDQRGHGRSGRSQPSRATINQLGADLRTVIDAATPDGGPVVLVGHSMGGMTIMALAEQHPSLFGTKVAGVVLIATAVRGLDDGSPWMPGLIRPMLRRALPGVLNGVAMGQQGTLGRVPVIVMVAGNDRLIAPGHGIELAMEIPSAQLMWVPGAGHALILERPGLVTAAITGLLAALDAAGDLPRSA